MIDQNELLERLQVRLEYEVDRGYRHHAEWDADERRLHTGRVEGMRILLAECFAYIRDKNEENPKG